MGAVTTRLLVAAMTLAMVTTSHVAAAQDCERGRELFDRAIEALGEGRAALGRDLLDESSRVCPRFATYMNLAIALRRTGEVPRAIELLRELLSGRHGELDPARRRDVEAQLELAVAELATLRLRVSGPNRTSVEVDGEVVGTSRGSAPLDVPIAAGEHMVRVAADGWSARRERVTVASGELRDLAIALTRAPELAPADSEDEESSFPTGWVLGGVAAVLAVAAIIAVVVVVTQNDAQDPRVVGAYETLRFP